MDDQDAARQAHDEPDDREGHQEQAIPEGPPRAGQSKSPDPQRGQDDEDRFD
jgi:hypothetical protein